MQVGDLLKVIIVGRPNVGKSTLFNRMLGRAVALVADYPGVTRDRREERVNFFGQSLLLMDTAGLAPQNHQPSLTDQLWKQTQNGLHKADVILFVFDAQKSLNGDDHDLAQWVREINQPVILVGNKCEGLKNGAFFYEGYQLGLGEPIAISAAHGEGLSDLAQALEQHSPKDSVAPVLTQETLELAIIGRPNGGKSTLFNRLIGQDRVMTSPQAGTTRDAIGIFYTHQGRTFHLMDTAGLRRKARLQEGLEKQAAKSSLRALRFCDIALLVLDATIALERQDCILASHILDEGRGLIIVLNKWDCISHPTKRLADLKNKLQTILSPGWDGPMLLTSARTGMGVGKIFKTCLEIEERLNTRIPTARLNAWLLHATAQHPPPYGKNRRIKLKYITQHKTKPPTFAIFGNQVDDLPSSYIRYLSNNLRETFGLGGVPLRFQWRLSHNPYQNKT